MKEDIDYRNLMVRFFDKTATDDELQKLSEWLKESDENKQLFNEFNESYQFADISVKGWIYDTDANWKQIKNRIQSKQNSGKIRMLTSRQYNWLSVAAIITLLLMVGSMARLLMNQSQNEFNNQKLSVIAPSGQKSQVVLQDGTKVWLNSDTELTYKYDVDDNKRIVTLDGEAFFDVAKDKERPFIVQTDGIDLVVYGTRFNVHSYKDERIIETTLEEGSVGVKVHASGKEWLMKPGQQCIYNKELQAVEMEETNVSFYTAWTNDKLIFDDNTFIEVVRKLERWYGVQIELDEELFTSERFTLTITHESLTEVMELIKVVAPIQYTINERNVRITKQ
ncbi:FecR domain-containing protein [Carboxylicivirga mesophila]|uniref:FecR domain-containing protein n=1 Tax=Carboxylicivirga mesophila TaxID=1166478 RepID=A0ABS5K9S2_9BACT|nr:FecR domain-containing protein [Carboxylicivirga mesophila]MBS2211779.1 FecR domain-containing protein [Carboxylicivirga mesophila]